MRALPALALTAALTIALSGCTSGPDPSTSTSSPGSTSPTSTDSPAASSTQEATPKETPKPGSELVVTISGDEVLPNAKEISIDTGESLVISFTSDRPGELHVHSKPEQVLEFPAGKSTQELVIETPGLVEVEEHETGAVVAQIKVGG
ncbi:hypothetical protein [Nocardioides sp. T2.26MG-1]|uniref:hypothetical protein n=1 Tax=Nocardioides sp. T2.26MG-1 TaxID=3041166 RepID=UPI00254109A7|nr:hypothetical protein [Nocardioides sp. T2.26MG-1]